MKKIFTLFLMLPLLQGIHAQLLQPRVLNVAATPGKTTSYQFNGVAGQVVTGNGNSRNYLLTQGGMQTRIKPKQYLSIKYNIGEIPNQTVFTFVETSFSYYSKKLGEQAALSFQFTDRKPLGQIKFYPEIGKFSFLPNVKDVGTYRIKFAATSNNIVDSQIVAFECVPQLKVEQTTFGLEPLKGLPGEDDDDYIVVTFTQNKTKDTFNYSSKVNTVSGGDSAINTYSVSIAGKKLIFDKNLVNKLQSFCTTPRNDIKEVAIFAETVVIRCPLEFRQSNVSITAKNLIFEDGAEKAFLNTSPIKIPILKVDNQPGIPGPAAGNIVLNIQNITVDYGRRFIAIGGAGQGSNKSSLGNGGNGGNVNSTLDITSFTDLTGGIGGGNAGNTFFGNKGINGSTELIDKKMSWLHPNYLRMVVLHAKAAYLNGYMNYTHKVFSEYIQSIEKYEQSSEWQSVVTEEKQELGQLRKDMESVLYRIAGNLDYFGNPAGWVPMLSFEVNKLAFDQEKDNAIKVLYLSYWLQKASLQIEQKLSLLQQGRSEQQKNMVQLQDAYNEVITLLPQLESEAQTVEKETQEVQQEIVRVENELMERAKAIVEERNKPSIWRSIGRAVGSLCQVIPVFQPALAAVGTGIKMLSNIDTNQPLGDIVNTGVSIFNQFAQADFAGSATNLKNTLSGLDISKVDFTKKDQVNNYFNKVEGVAKPIYDGIKGLKSKIGQVQAPNDEVKVELERLKAQSPEYRNLLNRLEILIQKKAELSQKIDVCLQNISNTSIAISQGVMTIDAMSVDIYAADSKRDLRAMIYVKEMERRAKERLIKYHYYMAKAYEFRLVQPYKGDINLPAMFDRIKNIVDTSKAVMLENQFSALNGIYVDAISELTSNILTFYNNNAPEKKAPIRFSLTKEDLNELNKGNMVNLNMVERGMFPPFEENIRIVDFKVLSLKTKTDETNNGVFGYVDINFEHTGISKIKKDGQIYIFNHYNNQNRNPIIWGGRYDVNNKKLDPKEPSASQTSLLRSLLQGLGKNDAESLILYSRPGAWADITISKFSNPDGMNYILDSVLIEVVYDYNQRPANLVNIDVITNNGMKPYISVSRQDINERQDGWGQFVRSYNRSSNSSIRLRAAEFYGSWKFDKWTTFRDTTALSRNPEFSVSLATDRSIKANYILIQPVLKVERDTIRVSGDSVSIDFAIKNIGNGNMPWYIKHSSNWMSFQKESGENNESIKIILEKNTDTLNQRITQFVVYAPSSIDYRDTITVIQERSSIATDLRDIISEKFNVYPNPASTQIFIKSTPRMIGKNYRLTDMSGITIMQGRINNANQAIRLESLSTGIYLLRVEGVADIHKIIKQ